MQKISPKEKIIITYTQVKFTRLLDKYAVIHIAHYFVMHECSQCAATCSSHVDPEDYDRTDMVFPQLFRDPENLHFSFMSLLGSQQLIRGTQFPKWELRWLPLLPSSYFYYAPELLVDFKNFKIRLLNPIL